MKKIIIISGTRADYGIYKPVAQQLIADNWDVSFLMSGMHLVKEHGYSKNVIKEDSFKTIGEVQSLFLENSKGNMARSVSLEIAGFTDVLERENPDFVLLLGDRGEMLAAAISCLYLGIKTAHLHGGEVSGTVDESIRHAITKLASIHFCATNQSKNRIIKMGENPWRVFEVGAPRIDSIIHEELPSFQNIKDKYSWSIEKKSYILLVFHPVVTEIENIEYQVSELIDGVKNVGLPILCILPNGDAGGDIIRSVYIEKNINNIYFIQNLTPEEYLTVLKECSFMIGNSSSGIIEAASFSIPVINIGSRQLGRERSGNIIDVEPSSSEILQAISKIQSKDFQEKVKNTVNVYGSGNTSEQIVEILNSILNEKESLKWIQKRIAY
ncbi:TPA: UDP-N-acetylglucosamine 2-epimerase [Enterococcus faecium]|uniref:UDP-N-acetylglucosamine 2-epimerase n=1 Tax=Enterococcus faecium TaxID=1352 RepID=UPI00032DE7CB|nr:UDP-N-acetylglucosamine 2-epimerase [Enterococcus faecium]EOF54308.1 UDP-N-acetyl-D-glucosamine 2-epimerase, UDP-hydrolysing [Enterococcus faecium EnGen0131]MCU4679185.1 UDP-N-acetylglucosamine 2-epimerase [Enterococcus faecium]MDT2332752.1 UDP-N-acetylglucosamine 2-epimerase [Enterococcus faecium]MDT2362946.1 UDP-N-acetylglucosamine 2-epimerase [Enterococcus faecium]MDV7755925.1 UDP-N-acetylglucosamine 2-epimerase [Enterococcus faecium]